MSSAGPFEFEDVGDVTVIRPTVEKLDWEFYRKLSRRLYHRIDDEGRTKFVFNMQQVKYLFSEAMGILVALKKRIESSGGKFRLCHVNDNVFNVLQASQLDGLFEIYEDESEALADF